MMRAPRATKNAPRRAGVPPTHNEDHLCHTAPSNLHATSNTAQSEQWHNTPLLWSGACARIFAEREREEKRAHRRGEGTSLLGESSEDERDRACKTSGNEHERRAMRRVHAGSTHLGRSECGAWPPLIAWPHPGATSPTILIFQHHLQIHENRSRPCIWKQINPIGSNSGIVSRGVAGMHLLWIAKPLSPS